MKIRKQLLCLIGLAGFLGSISPANVQAETQKQLLELPEKWDSRSCREIRPVQDQGKDKTCWALTAAAVLQASVEPEKARDLSAEHMIQASSFVGDKSLGGDYLMIMAYLSGWQGPVTEEEDPYGDDQSPDGLEPTLHVQEIQLLPWDRDSIKAAVFQYGAVQASMCLNAGTTAEAAIYQEEAAAYYLSEERELDHDVVILGWDDTFPAEAFGTDPGMDGAFLCQNSWGETFGQKGYFFVSYADANLGRVAIAYTRIEDTDNYQILHQNDECGWRGKQGYDDETCWFANIYTAKEPEELKAAGFYATGPDTSYELYFIPDFTGTESFENRQLLQWGTFEQAGYYTIDLTESRLLDAGERFGIAVRITTPDSMTPVAVEYAADAFTQKVVTEGREGYLSQYGENWENTEERYHTNICLKAYADLQEF